MFRIITQTQPGSASVRTGRRSRRALVTIATTGALLFAGCGGDGGSGSLDDLVDGGTDITLDDGSSIDLGDVSDDCVKASKAFEEAGKAFDEFSAGTGAEFDVDAFKSDVAEARSAVPEDIRGAYDTYMNALLGYAEVLDGVDPADAADPENMNLAIEALGKLTAPDVMTALEELTTYFTTECYGG